MLNVQIENGILEAGFSIFAANLKSEFRVGKLEESRQQRVRPLLVVWSAFCTITATRTVLLQHVPVHAWVFRVHVQPIACYQPATIDLLF